MLESKAPSHLSVSIYGLLDMTVLLLFLSPCTGFQFQNNVTTKNTPASAYTCILNISALRLMGKVADKYDVFFFLPLFLLLNLFLLILLFFSLLLFWLLLFVLLLVLLLFLLFLSLLVEFCSSVCLAIFDVTAFLDVTVRLAVATLLSVFDIIAVPATAVLFVTALLAVLVVTIFILQLKSVICYIVVIFYNDYIT